jgi:hypothetical protein
MSSVDCGSGGGDTAFEGLRIASLFIIWATGSFGAFFPVIAHRSSKIHLPHAIFESVSFLSSNFISHQFPTERPNILALALSSPPHLFTSSPPASASLPHPVLDKHGRTMSVLSPMVYMIAILIAAYDVALSPGTCSPIVVLHIYYRGHRLPHWHSQAQEAWHQTW